MYMMKDVPGKGKGVVTTCDVAEGAVIVSEAPVLLTVTTEALSDVCALCLRTLPQSGHLMCQETQQGCFCSTKCHSDAKTDAGACLTLRRRLARVPWYLLPDDEHHPVRFILQYLCIVEAAACGDGPAKDRLDALQRLSSAAHSSEPGESTQRVLDAVSAAYGGTPPLSLQEAATIISKDAANGYGIMAPSGADVRPPLALCATDTLFAKPCRMTVHNQGTRRIRGSGIYGQAALVNHDCLPNVTRVDAFDTDSSTRTHITLRTLHALPRDEEVLMSYMPLHWDLQTRQAQCAEVYGFVCTCARCKCEQAELSTSDSPLVRVDAVGAGLGVTRHDDGREALDPSYLHLFLMKYTCKVEGCFGTYVPEVGSPQKAVQCNICGHQRTEADFLQEVEEQLG